MAKVQLINIKGEKLKDLTLADNVWNIEANDIVLKKAIDLQLAATRQGTAKTKTFRSFWWRKKTLETKRNW